MQTPAEKELVRTLFKIVTKRGDSDYVKILNIGAGPNVSIENQLTKLGCDHVYDRLDIDDCVVAHPSVRNCWKCSVESMQPVGSNEYHAAFANYVLEHVPNLEQASQEIYRVLKPSGLFIATVPNTNAPEIMLAKQTSLWFHKMIRGTEAWKTYYAYKNISKLCSIFETSGFKTLGINYYPLVECYIGRFFLFGTLSRFYDKIISLLKIKSLMGNVCLVFQKPS